MNTSRSASCRAGTLVAGLCILSTLAVAALPATPALAATGEDSLICSRVKDGYSGAGYTASFWPRSEAYGSMAWCDLQVKAVEHCVPVEPVLHETTAPYEMQPGPALQREYTCYRIRCKNGEGSTFMGSSVPLDDMFGARTGDAPRVARVCLPDL